MSLRLIIGNKNYSSWSFRPWLAMKNAGIRFDEIVLSMDQSDFKQRVLSFSPAGKVPVLVDGDRHVWESLAILEYLAEKFPDAGLWPADPGARAHARTIAAEMHAGFAALRRHCPMNMRRPPRQRQLTPEAEGDVQRLDAMWTECRARFGGAGDFLFGTVSAADAMYAPVVSRFHTYGIAVSSSAGAYMKAVMALPAWSEWAAAAGQEPWVLPRCEVDWPTVLKC